MHEPKTKEIYYCAIKEVDTNLFCAGLLLKGRGVQAHKPSRAVELSNLNEHLLRSTEV